MADFAVKMPRPGQSAASMLGRLWRLRVGVLVWLVAACGAPRPPAPLARDPVTVPDPAEVESVLFLLGDAGAVRTATSPLLVRLGQQVEWWAERLEGDSAVALLVLGDVVYPEGVRDPDTSAYAEDTATVMSQVRLVTGPAALARDARAYVVAGNHDWGMHTHSEGLGRLRNLDVLLESARTWTGAAIRLVPEAGTGGPFVVDWGRHYRLLFLDTAWWLLEADEAQKQGVIQRIDEAFASAGDREVMLVAHHPFRSTGPHGGGFSFWEAIGFRYILHRSGAILQDLTSRPYRDLRDGLRSIFAEHGPPLAFIGGHEHSLQLLAQLEATDPRVTVVSGSGSKLSPVGPAPGLIFGDSAPGYMWLVIQKDGGVRLFVEAAPPDYLSCDPTATEPNPCIVEGVAAFETVYTSRLK